MLLLVKEALMLCLASRSISSMAIAAVLALAVSAAPAMALCKYGTPHCINKDPGPKAPVVNTTTIPDSNWIDPDCAYYGNCH
jgi:hypothetical protein